MLSPLKMIVSDSIYREFCAYQRDFLQLQLVQLEAVIYIFHKADTALLFPESRSTQARLNNIHQLSELNLSYLLLSLAKRLFFQEKTEAYE